MNTNQLYNGFDEVNIGSFLALTSGDTVLQTSVAGSDNLRMARSFDNQVTPATVEFVVYSPLFLNGTLSSAPVLDSAKEVMLGVCTVNASLQNTLGSDANGYGLNPGTGEVWNNNAVLVTLPFTYALGDYCEIIINPVTGNLQFLKNGVPNGSPIALSANGSWFYAATVSGDPGTYAVVANAGQTPLVYPAAGISGWGVSRPTIVPLNLATEPYMSSGVDTYPYEKYAGDMNPMQQQTTISDSVKFWMWGNSAPAELGSGGLVQFQVDDPNGIYTDLTSDYAYSNIVTISRLKSGAAMSTAETLFTGVFDHCEVDTRQTKQVYARDQLSRLQTAITRALFGPNCDATVAGKPRPLSMGASRNYEPTAYDGANFKFALHDGPVSALGRVRVAGKQVILGAAFNMTPDLAGIQFIAAPSGKILVESTSYGGAFNTGFTDYLAGVGLFESVGNAGGGVTGTSNTAGQTAVTGSHTITVTSPSTHAFTNGASITVSGSSGAKSYTGTVTSYNSGTGALVINATSVVGTGTMLAPLSIVGGVNQATGWYGGGGYPNAPLNQIWQVNGTAPNKFVRQAQVADAYFWTAPYDVPISLKTNHSYAYKLNIPGIPYFGPVTDANGGKSNNTPGYLVFGYNTNEFIIWNNFIKIPLDHTGSYSGVFINNTGSNQNLVIGFLPNNTIQGSGGISSYLDISDIQINELPALSDNVSLTGDTLTQMSKDLLVYHGPIADYELITADTDVIDAATGYSYGLHVNSSDTPLVSDLDAQLLSSCCSCRYPDEFGKFRTARLYAPEKVTGVANGIYPALSGSLTMTDTKGEIVCYPDLAENLTTRISGCRNYSPMAKSEYGSTTTVDTPLIVRSQLGEDYQWTVASGIQLAQRYAKRYGADALKTLLDVQAHGLAEIIYVNGLYKTPRNFYVGQFFEPVGRSFKLMQTWKLTYPLPTLAAGTQLVVVGRQRQPQQELVTLILWGN